MKIFELYFPKSANTDWFCGDSLLDALVGYINITDMDINDLPEAELREVPKHEWGHHFVINDDEGKTKQSFKEWMAENENGGRDMIATTAGWEHSG
jgi:hypothetical protein